MNDCLVVETLTPSVHKPANKQEKMQKVSRGIHNRAEKWVRWLLPLSGRKCVLMCFFPHLPGWASELLSQPQESGQCLLLGPVLLAVNQRWGSFVEPGDVTALEVSTVSSTLVPEALMIWSFFLYSAWFPHPTLRQSTAGHQRPPTRVQRESLLPPISPEIKRRPWKRFFCLVRPLGSTKRVLRSQGNSDSSTDNLLDEDVVKWRQKHSCPKLPPFVIHQTNPAVGGW